LGEATKLILSGVIFVFIVNYLHMNTIGALVGYIFAVLSFWVAAPLMLRNAL